MIYEKLFLVALIGFHAAVNLLGAGLIKAQINESAPAVVGDYLLMMLRWRVIGGIFLIGLGFGLLMVIMKRTDFSFFMPISLTLSFIITLIIARFLLHEAIDLKTGSGILLMVLGAVVLVR
jgi:drug/metabolite transporter (DMT)-like permease